MSKPVLRVITYGITDRKGAEAFLVKNCDKIRGFPGIMRVESGINSDSFTVVYLFRDAKDLKAFRESKEINTLLSEGLDSSWFKGLDSVVENVMDYIIY